MTKSTNKPSILYWVISCIALVWYVLGVLAYNEQSNMTDEIIASLPQPEQLYFNNIEPWVTRTYATAVFTGFFGSFALIIRKKIAFTLFIISLGAVLVQKIYNFFIQEYMPVNGLDQILGSAAIVIVALFLVWFSKNNINKGILS